MQPPTAKEPTFCGRDVLLGYKYILRPGTLLRPSDGVAPEYTASYPPHLPALGSALGGVALSCGAQLQATGKPRHVLLIPLLPLHVLTLPPRDFALRDVEGLRQDVDEADANGALYPPPPPPPAVLAKALGRGGGAAAAGGELALRAARADRMKAASSAVRSAFARASQNRGGRDRDRLSKARSNKARKVPRQSNLSKEWEKQRSDDDAGEVDYGVDDDELDDILMMGDAGALRALCACAGVGCRGGGGWELWVLLRDAVVAGVRCERCVCGGGVACGACRCAVRAARRERAEQRAAAAAAVPERGGGRVRGGGGGGVSLRLSRVFRGEAGSLGVSG